MLLSHFLLAAVLAHPAAPARGVTGPDSALIGAEAALARGRPWQASRLLASVLGDSSRRTPAIVLLAATAASRWNGWVEVNRLLAGQTWLDSLDGGRGRLLLARAALERGADSTALSHALMERPRDDSLAGERLLLLARALERTGARDSAAAAYLTAAERLPLIADWLFLRSAAVTDDSVTRAGLYRRITNPLPRARSAWAEAASHEHSGDRLGAAASYRALGAPLTALRLRLAALTDGKARGLVRRELLAIIADRPGAAREAIALLDSSFALLSPAEELAIARGAGAAGLAERAIAGYRRGFAAGLGGGEDRFGYASALARLGRYGEAAFQFNLVRGSLASSAAYLRARSLVRDGQGSEGRSALLEVLRRFPRDTSAASSALYLLSDLAADQRDDQQARKYYRSLVLRYPTSRFAPAARFRAALIAFIEGDPQTAAGELDQLLERHPGSDEALAAGYWAGRAWAEVGDSAAARARWERVMAAEPASYYASRSARWLGLDAWVPPAAADSFVPLPAADSAVARASLLQRLGLTAESGLEYDALMRRADSSSERLLALAHAFRQRGLASQSILLARRALAAGAAPDALTYRLLYPVIHEAALVAEAAEQEVEPSFVAALVRQESMFNPFATSPAGARGLMQVMPDLGARLADLLGYPVWDPVLLYQPDVSLQLGSHHLRELFDRYREPVHILAAYNAGVSRVERWVNKVGVEDPEVFAERIPFVETRGYVRVIQRNQELYRALYDWTTADRRL